MADPTPEGSSNPIPLSDPLLRELKIVRSSAAKRLTELERYAHLPPNVESRFENVIRVTKSDNPGDPWTKYWCGTLLLLANGCTFLVYDTITVQGVSPGMALGLGAVAPVPAVLGAILVDDQAKSDMPAHLKGLIDRAAQRRELLSSFPPHMHYACLSESSWFRASDIKEFSGDFGLTTDRLGKAESYEFIILHDQERAREDLARWREITGRRRKALQERVDPIGEQLRQVAQREHGTIPTSISNSLREIAIDPELCDLLMKSLQIKTATGAVRVGGRLLQMDFGIGNALSERVFSAIYEFSNSWIRRALDFPSFVFFGVTVIGVLLWLADASLEVLWILSSIAAVFLFYLLYLFSLSYRLKRLWRLVVDRNAQPPRQGP